MRKLGKAEGFSRKVSVVSGGTFSKKNSVVSNAQAHGGLRKSPHAQIMENRKIGFFNRKGSKGVQLTLDNGLGIFPLEDVEKMATTPALDTRLNAKRTSFNSPKGDVEKKATTLGLDTRLNAKRESFNSPKASPDLRPRMTAFHLNSNQKEAVLVESSEKIKDDVSTMNLGLELRKGSDDG